MFYMLMKAVVLLTAAVTIAKITESETNEEIRGSHPPVSGGGGSGEPGDSRPGRELDESATPDPEGKPHGEEEEGTRETPAAPDQNGQE